MLPVAAPSVVPAGDTLADIFTASPALHTDIIRDLAPREMQSARPNALISLQRRSLGGRIRGDGDRGVSALRA